MHYHSRDRDLVYALLCAHELERTVIRTRSFAAASNFGRVLSLILERVDEITGSLSSWSIDDWIPDAIEKVLALEATLANAALLTQKFVLATNVPPPARSAQRLIELVIMALPPAHQSRFGEELSTELNELANQPLRHQLAHAIRVGLRVWALRRALPAAPTAAEPVVRDRN
jgi:hypothetical protein